MFRDIAREILKNNVITPVNGISSQATTLKVQSNAGAFGFTVKGKLRSDLTYSPITLIKDNGLTLANSVSDGQVYTADITGYSDLTIETNGIVSDSSLVLFYIYGDN